MYPLAARRQIGGMGVTAGGAAAWTPASPIGGLTPTLWAIAGVENYQEASSPTTPADGDGEAIGYMNDQSAANNDLVRHNDDGRRPVLKLNIIGGESVARFDGTDDRLNITNTVISATGFYWFLVGKLTDAVASRTFMAEMDGTRRCVLYSTTSKFECRYFTGAAYVNGNQTVNVDTNAHVFTLEHTGSAVNLYVDGVAGSGNGSTIIDSTSLKNIGYSSLGFFKGDVAEVICYTGALTEAQRQQVEGYLTAKFF